MPISPPDDFESWCNGSFRFDEIRARELAQALDFDVPLFVGKALEVSLRHESKPATERSR